MFDFEKLLVYKKASSTHTEITRLLKQNVHINIFLQNQLKRASMSIVLNIAEGSGRFTKPDKKNFYTIARGSVYECVSIFDILRNEKEISENQFEVFYIRFEELSKMLLALISSQTK